MREKRGGRIQDKRKERRKEGEEGRWREEEGGTREEG